MCEHDKTKTLLYFIELNFTLLTKHLSGTLSVWSLIDLTYFFSMCTTRSNYAIIAFHYRP